MPKQTTTNAAARKKKIFIILAIIASLFILTLLASWLTRNQSLYDPNKDDVNAKVSAVSNTFDIEQRQPIYSKTEDQDCKQNSVGWLGKSTECSFQGWKIYKDNKGAASDLKKADTIIQGMGFKYKSGSLTGEKTATISYDDFDGLTVKLLFYRPDERKITAADYLKIPINDIQFDANDYAFGISIYAPYWSCSQDNWLRSCPTPPSNVKN